MGIIKKVEYPINNVQTTAITFKTLMVLQYGCSIVQRLESAPLLEALLAFLVRACDHMQMSWGTANRGQGFPSCTLLDH
jgi:hypothetical protein